MKYVLIAFLLYLAYRIIFHFVIPVYRTTSHLKKGFKEMQEKMQNSQSQHQQPPRQSSNSRPANEGDYIEFEEVK